MMDTDKWNHGNELAEEADAADYDAHRVEWELERERDEAQAEVSRLRQLLEAVELDETRMMLAREAAEAEVARLRDALIKSHGILERADRALEQADTRTTAAEAEVARLRAELAELTTCDCGKRLSRGLCHICDNDE